MTPASTTPARNASVPDAIAQARPFLKWVGGKAGLIPQLEGFFPKNITRYVEPFIGGGAVFFHLRARFPKMKAFLRDNNDELVNTYAVVRDKPCELMALLDEFLADYLRDRKTTYYIIRSRHALPKSSAVERAARMIFLNKTCFNGLWRVNARGEFNVPHGSQKNPSIYDADNIMAASRALRDVDLRTQDYRETLREIDRGDFAYMDPPYLPLSKTSNFTAYTKEAFGLAEQQELSALFTAASEKGARLLLSNSDTPVIRDLYKDFPIHTVRARRAINSDATKRGAISEVAVFHEGE